MAWVTHELPRSFWHTRRRDPREVEAVVVGGGVVGLSTAWWLARLAPKSWRIVLLEKDHLAVRASGRNAGFLLTGTPDPFTRVSRRLGREAALALWERTRENRELVRSALYDSGLVDGDFLPEGSWHASLAGEDGRPSPQEEELAESCQLLRDAGFDCEWRDAAAVREASGSAGLGGAIFQARDGGQDPVRLCRGLAETGGFEIHTGVEVTGLEPADGDGGGSGGERVRITTEARDWVAERAVVALNAYAGVLLPHLAPRLHPVRGQMLATERGERLLQGVWYINDGHEYIRQTGGGTVVLGGRRLVAEGSEVGFLEAPTARVQGALEDFLAEVFPHLAGRPVACRWAGIMAFTDSGLPLLGTVPDVPGTLHAAGFNGHGMSLGFVTGRHLAQRTLAEHRGEELPGELLPGAG